MQNIYQFPKSTKMCKIIRIENSSFYYKSHDIYLHPDLNFNMYMDVGRELCDQMCKQGYTPEEIVEFFKTWVSSRYHFRLQGEL